jgi:hypothetical protein
VINRSQINKLEKIGKTAILIPAIIGLIFIIFIIYSELTGKYMSFSLDTPIFKYLIWGGLLILIGVSIYELLRVYKEKSQ